MGNNLDINLFSLIFSTLLLIIPILISYKEELGLDKDIIIAGVRAAIQLFIVGYILSYVFSVNNFFLTLAMVAFIVFNASYNAHKRSEGIENSFLISLTSIGVATTLVLAILVLTGSIDWTPFQIVPITGMIANAAMIANGLTYRTLNSKFTDQRQQVLEKLSLGADEKQASKSVIRESIKVGLQPRIDSTKTVGLVSLPGMMSGLIFAGTDPTVAVRYQLVIMFMIIAVTSISCIIASYLAYKSFFNRNKQLIT